MAFKGDIQATRSNAAASGTAVIANPIRILFPQGIFCKTKTHVTAYTLLTDKYSGPNLTTTNG